MKKTYRIISVVTIIVIILGILSFNKNVYAENEENTTNSNTTNETPAETTDEKKENSNNNESKTNVTPTTETKKSTNTTESNKSNSNSSAEKKKSDNANLKNLGITPNDFKGFKAQTTTYNVNVPTDLESVTIYASAQDDKAKVTGTGKQNLQTGANKFDVVVTAEDGTTKTYTLNIIRDTSSQNTENVPDRYTGEGLASLNIENLNLTPSFDTQKYEYTVKYFGEKESLDINATATDPYYTIEITGNEKLVEGENIINILVSDPDGNNVATYQITVNKSLVDEEAIAREKQTRILLISIGVALGVVVIAVIIIIIKKRKNRKWDSYEEDDEIDENEYNQLEDYDEDMKTIEEINLSKDKARKQFLDNYEENNEDVDEFFEDEIDNDDEKRKKRKGKRFK